MICQKQLKNVKYSRYLGSVITSNARRTRTIKPSIAMVKVAINRKKTFHQLIAIKLKEETSEMLNLEHNTVWS